LLGLDRLIQAKSGRQPQVARNPLRALLVSLMKMTEREVVKLVLEANVKRWTTEQAVVS